MFQDFCFKQLCKLQVFNPQSDLITDVVNFVATSNKFGKIYVATGKGIEKSWPLYICDQTNI